MVRGRFFLLGQPLDGLRLVILGNLAGVFGQPGHKAVLIADGEVHVHEIDIDFEGFAGMHGLRFGRWAVLIGGGPSGVGASWA